MSRFGLEPRGDLSQPGVLAEVLRQAEGLPAEEQIHYAALRALSQARYAVELVPVHDSVEEALLFFRREVAEEAAQPILGEVDGNRAERNGDFSKAAEVRYGLIPKVEQELEALNQQLQVMQEEGKMLVKEEVDAEDIAEIVSKWTGIPITKMLQTEREKLTHQGREWECIRSPRNPS